MRNNRQGFSYVIVVLFVVLLAAGFTWANYQYASQPDTEDAFAPLWAGARIVITRQASPYDLDAISRSLRSVDTDPSRYVYPYYAVGLFLPFGMISPYPLAKAVWMTTLMVGLMVVFFGGLSLTTWKPSGKSLLAFGLFSLVGYSAMRALYTGNPAVLVAMLVVIGLQAMLKGRSTWAGFVFGLTIIKPTMVALLLPYVFLYAVSKRDFKLLRSMIITMGLLIGGAFAAFPGWFVQNFIQVVFLFKESFPSSISAVVASWLPERGVMVVLAVLFGLWLVIEWWRSLGKDSRWFLWTAALTLALTELIGIPSGTANYVVLLVPLTLVFSTIETRWKAAGTSLNLVFMVLIQLITWLPFYLMNGFDPAQTEPLFMLFPLPLSTLALLYWVRYWALASIKLQVERGQALRNL